jgi:hypothetical protein
MDVHYPETTSDMPETVRLARVEEIFLSLSFSRLIPRVRTAALSHPGLGRRA